MVGEKPMPQQLAEALRHMRAAVLKQLAARAGMYVHGDAFVQKIAGSSDAEVWSWVEQRNRGFLGYCRRLLVRVQAWRRWT